MNLWTYRIWLCLVLAFVVECSDAETKREQGVKSSPARSRLEWTAKVVNAGDFHLCDGAESREVQFEMRNSCEAVIAITHVETSCGCVVADAPKTVGPGETRYLKVKITPSATGVIGNNRVDILVKSDESGQPVQGLVASYNRFPALVVHPPKAFVTLNQKGSSTEQVFDVLTRAGEGGAPTVKAVELSGVPEGIRGVITKQEWDLSAQEQPGGVKYWHGRLNVHVEDQSQGALSPGEYLQKLTVSIDRSQVQTFICDMTIRVKGTLYFQPVSASLISTPGNRNPEAALWLIAEDGTAQQPEIQSLSKDVQIKSVERLSNTRFKVIVALVGQMQGVAKIHAEVEKTVAEAGVHVTVLSPP